jgi:hypothetical protein
LSTCEVEWLTLQKPIGRKNDKKQREQHEQGRGTGVISQKKEKTKRKKVQRIMQNTKLNEHKKKPNKEVTLMHAHRFPKRNDDLTTKEIEKA